MPRDHTLDMDSPDRQTPLAGSPAADSPGSGTPARSGGGRKRLVLGAVAAFLLLVAGYYGSHWWSVGRFEVTTDDAYVQADFAILAPKVTGYVASVPARENATVAAGDPLVVLEDGDYRNALAQAEAQLAVQNASVIRIDRQSAAAEAGVRQAHARVDAAKANADQAAADLDRYRRLASDDIASAQRLEAAEAADAAARAAVVEAEAGVATAEADTAAIVAQRTEATALLPGLEAARDRAERDLDATVLRAPSAGVVGNLSVTAGDFVAPGRRLLAVVPLDKVYVEANFKETQIAELAPGTPVTVTVDAFPDHSVTGTVEGVSPASGAVFSLLPPENATGNFTKVVQRVPVRIALPADVAAEGWLRPGLSVLVSADTRDSSAPAAR